MHYNKFVICAISVSPNAQPKSVLYFYTWKDALINAPEVKSSLLGQFSRPSPLTYIRWPKKSPPKYTAN